MKRAIVCAAALFLGGCFQEAPASPAMPSEAECEAMIRAADMRAVRHLFSPDTITEPLVRRTDQKAELYIARTGQIAIVGEVATDFYDASKVRYVLTTEGVMIADLARQPNARLSDARRNVILGDNRLVCTLYD